jgi:hypothetical protein
VILKRSPGENVHGVLAADELPRFFEQTQLSKKTLTKTFDLFDEQA